MYIIDNKVDSINCIPSGTARLFVPEEDDTVTTINKDNYESYYYSDFYPVDPIEPSVLNRSTKSISKSALMR